MSSKSIGSTKDVSPELLQAIAVALKDKHYGSIEIYVQNYEVTQITERTIRKIKTEEKVHFKS